MNYEEKYKQALSRATFYNNELLTENQRKMLLDIFPELAESGDERIRKGIIRNLQYLMDRSEGFVKEDLQERIAWLEKQGVNKEYVFRPIAGTMIENAVEQALKQGDVVLAFNGFYTPVKGKTSDEILTEYDHWLTREEALAWLEKQGEQTTDKVEPKFKVRDWITTTDEEGNVTTEKIIEFWGDKVRLIDINGFYTLWPKHELNYYHLWTIDDAKDGDVLVDSYSKDSIIILYKGIYKERTILAHCGWNGYNLTVNTNGFGHGGLDNTNYLPATKEQRDLLFQKMKEAGYKWDAEKKELKKIEVKSENIEPKPLDANKVIEWLNDQACLGWIEDIEIDKFIDKFKKDFGL